MVRNIVIKCWSYDFELHMHAVYQNFSDKNNYLKHTSNYYYNYFLFKKIAPVPLYLVYTFKQQLPSKTVTRDLNPELVVGVRSRNAPANKHETSATYADFRSAFRGRQTEKKADKPLNSTGAKVIKFPLVSITDVLTS